MIFKLPSDFVFPPIELAEDDGLLAVGGDLKPERLLLAYRSGIFPWYSEETPILWYAPHERFVLFPLELKIRKSMRQFMRNSTYKVTFNQAFEQVIAACARIERREQGGTWITSDMKKAYIRLHELGFAHSIEVWEGEELVGGLYGVLVQQIFCGESMFSKKPNGSKVALIWLCENVELRLIDCQVYTSHLESMGARMIPAADYVQILKEAAPGA